MRLVDGINSCVWNVFWVLEIHIILGDVAGWDESGIRRGWRTRSRVTSEAPSLPTCPGILRVIFVSCSVERYIYANMAKPNCYAALVHTASRLSAADRVKYREMILLTVFARMPTVRIPLSLPPMTVAAILRQIRHLLKFMKSPDWAVVSGAGPCW